MALDRIRRSGSGPRKSIRPGRVRGKSIPRPVVASVPALFRTTPFLRWLVAAVLGRLSLAAAPVALLAAGSQIFDSVAVGARLAAAVSVSTAVFAPFKGRRLDRHGLSRGLRASLWQSAVAAVAVAVALHLRATLPWVDVAAAVLGYTLAILPAGFRAMVTHLVEDRMLQAASNLDAVAFEVSLISAPLVVAGVVAITDATVIFLLGGVLTAVSAVLVPVVDDSDPRPPARWRQIPAPGVMGAALLLGVSGGLLEPAVFARMTEVGRSESVAAVLLAVVGVGSALAGMVASLRPPAATSAVAARLLVAHGLTVVAVAFAPTALTMGAVLFVAGQPIAPLMAVGATLLDRRVPKGERSTALALGGSAIALGTGVGQALAGPLVSQGTATVTFLAGGLVAMVTGVVVWLRRLARP